MDTRQGLSESDAQLKRKQFGYNELPAPHKNPVLQYLKRLWGPLPWLMELLIVINFFSGNGIEAWVIIVLLFINSGISTLQQRSTDEALASLSKHLTVEARVKRDGSWCSLPTRELVPEDLIRVRGGDIVPADATILDGFVSVDLSSLTGESLPKDQKESDKLYSGSVIRRGEASARVFATGVKTMYGKTTELLEVSHPPTHMEQVIFAVIKFFIVWNLAIAVAVSIYGYLVHAAQADVFNFVIVLLMTSVPIAFPTMFAIAQSYGALELSHSKKGRALVRRLAAVQECAIVDVLCSDKTGTLTMNTLEASELTCYGTDEMRLLSCAAACADEADRDPIDMAIFAAAAAKGAPTLARSHFVPFNPETKRTEANVQDGPRELHIMKGLPELLLTDAVGYRDEAKQDLARMSAKGLRVVAVVVEREEARECMGLIGFSDPIRPEVPRMIEELRSLGLRLVMITGDGRTTAQTVAASLGLSGAIVTPRELRADPSIATKAAVFAETYPSDKLAIIEALQKAGHAVAMTGDGVNDAPALHQAEVGIAVSNATDVAKQSASLILTDDGLEGVVSAVRMSRGVYSRLRTWTLNKIIKSFEVSTFTTVLFVLTHSYIFSPMLAVLVLFANDFLTISIATDAAAESPAPGRWKIFHLALGAIALALAPLLALSIAYALAVEWGYSLDAIRTTVYLVLVCCGIGTLYAIRSWPHGWSVAPSRTLVLASIFSLLFALAVAGFGLFTTAIPLTMILSVIAIAFGCFFLTDLLRATPFVYGLIFADGAQT